MGNSSIHRFQVQGDARSLCGNEVCFNCGDDQDITLVKATFATRELAWAVYCKSFTIAISPEPSESKLPAEFVKEYKSKTDGATVMGVPIEELTREELLATIGSMACGPKTETSEQLLKLIGRSTRDYEAATRTLEVVIIELRERLRQLEEENERLKQLASVVFCPVCEERERDPVPPPVRKRRWDLMRPPTFFGFQMESADMDG